MNVEEAKKVLALFFSRGQSQVLLGKWDTHELNGDAVLFANAFPQGRGGAMYLVRGGRVGIVNLAQNTIDEVYEALGTV